MSYPATEAVPEVSGRSPVSMLNTVVLPAPMYVIVQDWALIGNMFYTCAVLLHIATVTVCLKYSLLKT